jgi:hypothetical protein
MRLDASNMIVAPALANASAVAFPIPEVAPVTMHIFPCISEGAADRRDAVANRPHSIKYKPSALELTSIARADLAGRRPGTREISRSLLQAYKRAGNDRSIWHNAARK